MSDFYLNPNFTDLPEITAVSIEARWRYLRILTEAVRTLEPHCHPGVSKASTSVVYGAPTVRELLEEELLHDAGIQYFYRLPYFHDHVRLPWRR